MNSLDKLAGESGKLNFWFSARDIVLMQLALESYTRMPECPEPEKVKTELRECARRMECILQED